MKLMHFASNSQQQPLGLFILDRTAKMTQYVVRRHVLCPWVRCPHLTQGQSIHTLTDTSTCPPTALFQIRAYGSTDGNVIVQERRIKKLEQVLCQKDKGNVNVVGGSVESSGLVFWKCRKWKVNAQRHVNDDVNPYFITYPSTITTFVLKRITFIYSYYININ